MHTGTRIGRWKLTGRETRMLLYLAVFAGVVAWKFAPRPWKPALTLETAHYSIASTATRQQTEEIAQVVEANYLAYSNLFQAIEAIRQPHPKLKLRLYRDRAEFRRVNPGVGWAEAFYRRPRCHAYYSDAEINPYHWMLHEAVHQLNREVARLSLEKWLDEGLALYFSTRLIRNNAPVPGAIDSNAYPVWWIDELATTGHLDADLKNGSVIPLRAILEGRGGPNLDEHFNLYYLHWWSLAHFLFEDAPRRSACLDLVRSGGSVRDFERLIGPVEETQQRWHVHVGRIKAKLSGADLRRTVFKGSPHGLGTNRPPQTPVSPEEPSR